MSYDGRGVGLANATNSNTDTSARVHTTARVCLNLYNSLTDPNHVKRHPAEFKAVKEQIALGLSRPFDPLGMSYAEQRGLAPVFTNTSVISGSADAKSKQDDLMRWYIRFFDCRSKEERISHCGSSCSVKGQAYFPSELYFAGIVMSEAEADPMNGEPQATTSPSLLIFIDILTTLFLVCRRHGSHTDDRRKNHHTEWAVSDNDGGPSHVVL